VLFGTTINIAKSFTTENSDQQKFTLWNAANISLKQKWTVKRFLTGTF